MKGFTTIDLLLALAIVALLGSISVPIYDAFVDRANTAQAVADIGRIDMQIERYISNTFQPPDSLADVPGGDRLDPWGQAYQYLRIAGNNTPGLRGRLRKDRNLVPINSDYDLYSLGPDGESRPPLNARPSLDDVVRAADGSFVGVAEDF